MYGLKDIKGKKAREKYLIDYIKRLERRIGSLERNEVMTANNKCERCDDDPPYYFDNGYLMWERDITIKQVVISLMQKAKMTFNDVPEIAKLPHHFYTPRSTLELQMLDRIKESNEKSPSEIAERAGKLKRKAVG